ncbi:unnamed protein product [Trichobilharzia regenti]|nr:unnamed protein product [Trichobilharzia regenti]
MRSYLIFCLTLTLFAVNTSSAAKEDDELTESVEDIAKALINLGLDYVIRLDEWLDKNVGKKELKEIKQNLMKFSQLAVNFIDTSNDLLLWHRLLILTIYLFIAFASILTDDDTEKEEKKTKHSEL